MASADQQKSFILRIAPIMQAESRRRGYKVCSGAIAQACLESAYGTSSLGYKYHNYFGLKCGSSWKGASVNMRTREEYTPGGVLTSIRDNFRAYESMVAGVSGYYDFIQAKRYAALKSATSAQDYLEKIKAAGYATSSQYVANNMAVVRKHNLESWDLTTSGPAPVTDDIPKRVLRNGSSGRDVKWLQTQLNKHGYALKVDGLFGPRTEAAVRDLQNRSRLVCDGLVGPKTIAALLS